MNHSLGSRHELGCAARDLNSCVKPPYSAHFAWCNILNLPYLGSTLTTQTEKDILQCIQNIDKQSAYTVF